MLKGPSDFLNTLKGAARFMFFGNQKRLLFEALEDHTLAQAIQDSKYIKRSYKNRLIAILRKIEQDAYISDKDLLFMREKVRYHDPNLYEYLLLSLIPIALKKPDIADLACFIYSHSTLLPNLIEKVQSAYHESQDEERKKKLVHENTTTEAQNFFLMLYIILGIKPGKSTIEHLIGLHKEQLTDESLEHLSQVDPDLYLKIAQGMISNGFITEFDINNIEPVSCLLHELFLRGSILSMPFGKRNGWRQSIAQILTQTQSTQEFLSGAKNAAQRINLNYAVHKDLQKIFFRRKNQNIYITLYFCNKERFDHYKKMDNEAFKIIGTDNLAHSVNYEASAPGSSRSEIFLITTLLYNLLHYQGFQD